MKSSYKLHGSVWDRRKVPRQCPVVTLIDKNSADVFLKLSEQINKETLEVVAFNMNWILEIDFVPNTKSIVVWDLYLIRVLQIIEFYQVKVVYCSNVDYIDVLNKNLKAFYKRKTPERLLAQSVGVFQMIC